VCAPLAELIEGHTAVAIFVGHVELVTRIVRGHRHAKALQATLEFREIDALIIARVDIIDHSEKLVVEHDVFKQGSHLKGE
jgi:hypothetical protein